MKTALLITDMQNDFLPGGALGVDNGHTIIPGIEEMTKETAYDAYVFSQDWHPRDHISFSDDPKYRDRSWPPHCVINTEGAELTPAINVLKRWLEARGRTVVTVLKGQHQDHEAYSPFDELAEVSIGGIPQPGGLTATLQRLDIQIVENVGIATDYCVTAGAIDAANDGFESRVMLDLTMPVAVGTGMRAIANMSESGVRFS